MVKKKLGKSASIKSKKAYWSAFFDSYKPLFSDYRLFLPSLIMLVVGMVFIFYPGYSGFLRYSLLKQTPPLSVIINFALSIFVVIIISLIVYGWEFFIVKNVILRKKFELFEKFKNWLSYTWSIFAGFLLFVLTYALVFVLLVILFTLLLSPLFLASKTAGAIVLALVIIAAIIVHVPLFGFALRLTSVILMEEKGPIKSIALSFAYFKKDIYSSSKMFLITIVVILPLIIVNSIVTLIIGQEALLTMLFESPIKYFLIMLPQQILSIILSLWLLIFYAECYNKRM